MGDYVLLTSVACIFFLFFLYLVDMGMFVSGSVIILLLLLLLLLLFDNCYLGSWNSWRGRRRTAGICVTFL